jgi:uncharacterized membrane protein
LQYLLPFFKWSDASWIGLTVRSSRLYFPVVETLHLLALTLLLGAIFMLNLRLCGLVMKNLPVRQVSRDLSPWLTGSLIAILATGFVLFSSEAMKCYSSGPFQAKMLFLFAAIAYHFTIYRKLTNTDREPKRFWGATAALVSVVLWLGVGLAGRGIAFL